MNNKKYLLLLGILLVLQAKTVSAYLDPGTGSMLIQILIGGIATAGFAVKVYWKKVKGFFRR